LILNSAPSLIEDFFISDCNDGVLLNYSPGSLILNNQIGFRLNGIKCNSSGTTIIDDNIIGYPTQRGKIAINLIASTGSWIRNNPKIEATSIGIRTSASSLNIIANTVNIYGENDMVSGGIQLIAGTGSQVSSNYITATNSIFGIETNNCINTTISYNDIDLDAWSFMRSAAIRSNASINEDIDNNIIYSHHSSAGVAATTSTNNTYECNDIYDATEGISVNYNAQFHEIKANDISYSNTDLAIRSMIGQQPFHGNTWQVGNARAIGLSDNDLLNSRFYVNDIYPYHMPSNPIPSNGEWFNNDPQALHYFTCISNPGPQWMPYGGDPAALCNYYQELMSMQDSIPEQVSIRLYHLLKLEKRNDAGFVLPDCIKLDIRFLSLCGLVALVDVELGIDDVLTNHTDDALLRARQADHINDSSGSHQMDVSAILPSIHELQAEWLRDSLSLDSIKYVLDGIDCSEYFVEDMQAVLHAYIQYLQDGELSAANDRQLLNQKSQKCADRYGDAIHLARALAGTYSTSYFDLYDGCGDVSNNNKRLAANHGDELISGIYPNPSTSGIAVYMNESFTGTISIVDISGKVILNQRLDGVRYFNHTELMEDGLYIVRLLSDEGSNMIHKVTIAK
jgi:hypothetical protein